MMLLLMPVRLVTKMKQLIILSGMLLCLYACSGKQDAAAESTDNMVQQTSDDQAAVQSIIDFYKWYRDQPSIQNCLVLNSCNEEFDSTKFYAVDFKATESYLEKLKRSGYVSDKYIVYWRDYFKTCDENFKKDPVNDGIADGFDYDFVTNSQDFEEELNTVEKAKAVGITKLEGKKTVTLQFTTGSTLTFEMSMAEGRWYIDKIK